ncbi:phosphoglycerate dehydrogenase [Persicirhabdus sediminis]|uniref:D-3-phosphoglycerate dehydrogenase n=1 Tax=Persicirhabdus sediminis TaxID=454144 RepID=A0A8J7MEW5_9BACT|nr:phosphoglycerate dehydrogenase [Persicirhabdus sediminis]MBK1791420.1 phosphoglycerate dehydrogenase [Persicirhabdus sediminis]
MATKRILVSDPISEKGVALLADHPELEVDVNTGLAPEELLKIIPQYDGLIVRSQTTATAEVIEAATKLKAIGRAGVGVDNIDRDAATNNGVVVMNTPTGNTISTAEHAFSLLLSLARHIPQAHGSILAGRWDRKKYQGTEVNGKRLAVIGMGRIGAEFAKRAQAFGMTVVAYDPFLSAARAEALKVELAETVDQALTGADCVTLHVPMTPDTKHIINADRIELLNKGALIVNCARGGLIDEVALAAAVKSGRIGGAALDVFENEPPTLDQAVFDSDERIIFTPHLGASTNEAQENVGIQVAEQLRDFFTQGAITNAVNMPSLDAKTAEEIGDYLELATSLGKLLSKLAPHQPDSLRVTYYGAVSELETSAITRTALTGYLTASRQEGQVNLVNCAAIAKSMGLQITESTSAEEADFTELIKAEIVKGDEVYTVAGTFVGSAPRIVNIEGQAVETAIKGNFIIVKNDDRPGIVGTVGTVLADKEINISNMSLSRNKDLGYAVNVIQLDSAADESVINLLTEAPGILAVTAVEL